MFDEWWIIVMALIDIKNNVNTTSHDDKHRYMCWVNLNVEDISGWASWQIVGQAMFTFLLKATHFEHGLKRWTYSTDK